MMELLKEHIDVIKIIGGILCILAAIPFWKLSRPRHKERRPGDMLDWMNVIGATASLIGLGIYLIAWALDKTIRP